MTKLIYTCLFGNYEIPQPLRVKSKGFNHILFTDDKELKVEGWDIHYIEPKENSKNQSREVKINIHKFYEADLYVYIDCNYRILHDINYLVQKYFKGGYLTLKHYSRSCIKVEAEVINKLGRENSKVIDEQIEAYFNDGYPFNYGMLMNGLFIRDNTFNWVAELWYKEVEKHSYRDQISLPYILWKTKFNILAIHSTALKRFFQLMPHSLIDKTKPNIYHFVPGAGDKNLGREINKHCEIVPNDNDWIVIRDNDTCYLHPYINKQLEDIIKKHGNDYQLFSCVTNRLGLKYQLPYGLMDETNILKIRELAEKHYKEYYDEVIPCSRLQPTAGLFTMFQKKTWNKLKYVDGLATPGAFIDWQFTHGHLQLGHKIGICKGVFLFHYYRMHQDNWREYKHLL